MSHGPVYPKKKNWKKYCIFTGYNGKWDIKGKL